MWESDLKNAQGIVSEDKEEGDGLDEETQIREHHSCFRPHVGL